MIVQQKNLKIIKFKYSLLFQCINMTWKINKENSDFLKFTERKNNIYSLITLEYTEDIGYSVNGHVIEVKGDSRKLLVKNSEVFSDKKKALLFINELKEKINQTYYN